MTTQALRGGDAIEHTPRSAPRRPVWPLAGGFRSRSVPGQTRPRKEVQAVQGIIIGLGVAVATVGAFWPRRQQTGWRANDWVALGGLATAVGGLLVR